MNYENAGTVEFLVDDERHFYFLEINPRLQVEHGVTEQAVGVGSDMTTPDLVEWQLRVADGGKLPVQQEEVVLVRSAMECRIYAEDPARDFLPGTGSIVGLQEPSGATVRVESGITEGMEVGIEYDPMLAKLITWGHDRATALRNMLAALREYRIEGVANNLEFLQDLLQTPAVTGGCYDTGTVGDFVDCWSKLRGDRGGLREIFSPWLMKDITGGWRLGGERVPWRSENQASKYGQGTVDLNVSGELVAPMPGKIVRVSVTTGARVKAGEILIVMEAMKMEYNIKSPMNGSVELVACKEGDKVPLGAKLVVLKDEELNE